MISTSLPIYCIVKSEAAGLEMAPQFGKLSLTEDSVDFFQELPLPDKYQVWGEEATSFFNHLQIIDYAFNERKDNRAIFCTGGLRLSSRFWPALAATSWSSTLILGYQGLKRERWNLLQTNYLSFGTSPNSIVLDLIVGTSMYALDASRGIELVNRYLNGLGDHREVKNLDLLTLDFNGKYLCPPLAILSLSLPPSDCWQVDTSVGYN